MVKTVFVLGRQPNLGLVELESLLGPESITSFKDDIAMSNESIEPTMINRLGGTIKIGHVTDEINATNVNDLNDHIRRRISDTVSKISKSKVNVGISYYGVNISHKAHNQFGISVKQSLKNEGRSVRVIPNVEPALNSAQVYHNKLAQESGLELLAIKRGDQILLARTVTVQNINSYAMRDQRRPKRDARIGMLPPKLAQIIVNLAVANKKDGIILDPFCGTGTILQESLLMDYPCIGSDNNPRMVDYAEANLEWLAKKSEEILPKWSVSLLDATTAQWPSKFNTVACEAYLGKPMHTKPTPEQLKSELNSVNTILVKALTNIARQILPGTRICIAVPSWQTTEGIIKLPLVDYLSDIGYNLMSFKTVDNSNLLYYRPEQIVARQLLVLIRN